jgi:hypothetical protein
VIVLFGPEHAGERLAHHEPCIVRKMFGHYCLIEVIGFMNSGAEDLFEIRECLLFLVVLLYRSDANGSLNFRSA